MKWIKFTLKYLSLFLFLTLFFIFLLFPFNDLSQLVSDQFSRATRNEASLQFQNLSFSLLPLGLKMSAVNFETRRGMKLNIEELTLRPSVSGALKKQPFGFVSADGFLSGSVQAQMNQGPVNDKGLERYKFELKVDQIQLANLKNIIKLPLAFQGQVVSQVTAMLSPSLFDAMNPQIADQPESEFSMNVSSFKIPNSNIDLGAMGLIPVPELNLKKIESKGSLQNSNLVLESVQLGQSGDDLTGTLKGQVQMNLEKLRSPIPTANPSFIIAPRFGPYSFEVKLNIKPDFEKRASFYLIFLSAYKTSQPGQYNFKITGSSFMSPPQISALR